jgi:hypothetical protein
VKAHPNILYVHALGGHGIAVGTLLGNAAAEKIWDMHLGEAQRGTLFDTFAAIPHGWLPSKRPWRCLAAAIGLVIRSIWS